jgi:hypothetical protein
MLADSALEQFKILGLLEMSLIALGRPLNNNKLASDTWQELPGASVNHFLVWY